MNNKLFPCIWYNGNAKEAAGLYSSAFGNTTVAFDNGMVILLDIDGCRVMGLNGGPMFSPNASISFFVSFTDEASVDNAWKQLKEGGTVFMELNQYPWSNKYGWIQDKFGVSWQLMMANPGMEAQTITPALMFTHTVAGKAEEAMQLYTSLFPNSSVQSISRYEKEEGGVEGTVKHGRFLLNGQLLVAFDSHMFNTFTFNEGVSLCVNCDTQQEIDHYWNNLTAGGGEESMCGWLKDKFGVSWQIVPADIASIISDPEKGQRAMQALMQMKKIDVDKLRNA